MAVPSEVSQLAIECDEKYPGDIDKATKLWMKKIISFSGFDKWKDELVEREGRHMISNCRHTRNTRYKNKAGEYGRPAKVVPGDSVIEVFQASYFDYAINGTRLGSLMFAELPDISADFVAKADGNMFNANLCDALYRLRPKKGADKKIEEGVKESKVRSIFQELQK